MAQESGRSAITAMSSAGPQIHASDESLDPTARSDSNLRLAIALIDAKDWGQLASRTGIECFSSEIQFLSLFVEFDPDKIHKKDAKIFEMELLRKFELLAPSAYAKEYAINPKLHARTRRACPAEYPKGEERASLGRTISCKIGHRGSTPFHHGSPKA